MNPGDDVVGMASLPNEVLGATVSIGGVGSAFDLARLSPSHGWVRVFADRTSACVEVDGVARYRVERGTSITIDPVPGAPVTAVRTWLHGTVLALVAAQQGRFALHASVVDLDGRRIAVAGRKGAGKSTTVVAAAAAGGRVVSDDVAVLEARAGRITSVPFGRRVHLHREVATRLSVDLSEATPVGPAAAKVALPAPRSSAAPLDTVVVLVPGEGEVTTMTTLLAPAAARAIRRHTYRLGLVEQLWGADLFRWQAGLVRGVPVHRLVRPTGWSTDTVVEQLRSIAARGGDPSHRGPSSYPGSDVSMGE